MSLIELISKHPYLFIIFNGIWSFTILVSYGMYITNKKYQKDLQIPFDIKLIPLEELDNITPINKEEKNRIIN